MSYPYETFDSIFIYNAFAHIDRQLEAIEIECKRVLKNNGKKYIIGSWKIDVALMESLFSDNADCKLKRNGEFLIAELNKN